MKHTKKFKKVGIATIAIMCALSSVAAISASASTWTHTVSVATNSTAMDSINVTMDSEGRMSDTFASYPTIFDGYSKSTNHARAYMSSINKSYGWKIFTLTENSASPITVTYGTSLPKGDYVVQYQNVSNGGFRDSAILTRTY